MTGPEQPSRGTFFIAKKNNAGVTWGEMQTESLWRVRARSWLALAAVLVATEWLRTPGSPWVVAGLALSAVAWFAVWWQRSRTQDRTGSMVVSAAILFLAIVLAFAHQQIAPV